MAYKLLRRGGKNMQGSQIHAAAFDMGALLGPFGYREKVRHYNKGFRTVIIPCLACLLVSRQVMYETQVYVEEQALDQQFAELNKVFPAQVRRTKVRQEYSACGVHATDACQGMT
jgi:hypothetical protein